MNKRDHREAIQAKRASPDDVALARSFGGPVDFTQAELLAADKAYDAEKSDPAAWDRKIHRLHADEVQIMRILGSAL